MRRFRLFRQFLVQDDITSSSQGEVAVDLLLLYKILDSQHLRRLKIGNLNCGTSAVFIDMFGHIKIDIRLQMAA